MTKTKRQRKAKPIQYTIRTDSFSVGKLFLWCLISGALLIAAVSLILLPAVQQMPGNQENWQTMKNATGTYTIEYVPTQAQVFAGIEQFVVGLLACFGVLFVVYFYRPGVQWKVSRDKQMASVIDTAMQEQGVD